MIRGLVNQIDEAVNTELRTRKPSTYEWLLSKETVAPPQWESERLKFGIIQVGNGQISIVKR